MIVFTDGPLDFADAPPGTPCSLVVSQEASAEPDDAGGVVYKASRTIDARAVRELRDALTDWLERCGR